jgi:Integrase core domain
MDGYFNKLIMYHEIQQRSRLGWKPSQIAAFLVMDARTVNRYLAMSEQEYSDFLNRQAQRQKKLEKFENYVKTRLQGCPEASSAQVHDWLKENHPEFPDISTRTVYNFVQGVRQKHHIPMVFSSRDYEQVPECPYGLQVQVDFGEYNMTDHEERRRKVHFMAMVLARSRYKFVTFSDRSFTTAMAIAAHEAGFAFFGGYPKEVVYDQDKLLLTDENLGQLILTEEFRAYHQDRGFNLHFCRKSDPESKGKIENVIKYVKYNFLRGRKYFDVHTLNAQGLEWLSRPWNGHWRNCTYNH